ncbi:MAG: SDR family oxidoreductase [Bdellovibrionota bacterium]
MMITNDVRGIALVTGAGSGVGAATAKALALAGFTVVLAARRLDALRGVNEEISKAGGNSLPVVTDVQDVQSVQNLFATIRTTYGRLDLLFNNAGVNVPAVPIDELTDDQWDEVVGVNLSGSFYCAREAFRLMKTQNPRGGRIINNGSVSAHAPRPNSVPYTTTKTGISGLTRALSLDGREFDIACGQIDIGNAETAMTGKMKTGMLQANGATAVEPVMDVQHVADAVVYMASLPLNANVSTITVMATKMPFVGRG